MKFFVRLFINLFLLSSFIHADDAVIQSVQADITTIKSAMDKALDSGHAQYDNFDVIKFKSLVNAVLKSEKVSIAKRATVELLREIIKMGGFNLLCKYHDSQADIFHLILASSLFLPPFLADRFVGKLSLPRDKSVDAMQKLQTYISKLDDQQKKELSVLFQQKYEKLLSDKLNLDKDNKKLQIARLAVALFDLYWLFKQVVSELRQRVDLLIDANPVVTIDPLPTKEPVMVNAIDPLTRQPLTNPQTGEIIKEQELDDNNQPVFRYVPVARSQKLSFVHIKKASTMSLLILAIVDTLQIISNFINSPDRQKAYILNKIKDEFQQD